MNTTFFFDRRSRANESTDPWTSTFASHPVSCSRGHSTMAINAWSAGFGAAARVRHPVTEEGGKFRVTPWRRGRRACWKRGRGSGAAGYSTSLTRSSTRSSTRTPLDAPLDAPLDPPLVAILYCCDLLLRPALIASGDHNHVLTTTRSYCPPFSSYRLHTTPCVYDSSEHERCNARNEC